MSGVPTAHVQILRVVVASPHDVQAERNALPTVIEEVNNSVAGERALRLELARWETDAYPGFHPEGPQGLIDAILRIEDCDILIGIFWKRFGTPVQDANAGTEHEFRRAYKAWRRTRRPHIMVYFNQRPYKPKTRAEADQWGQVLTFQENFPQEGLWWAYKGKQQFERLVRQHLTRFIRDQTPRPADTPRARQAPGHLPPEAITALRRSYLTWLMEQVRAAPLAGIDPKSIREETRHDLDLAAVYTAPITQRTEGAAERGPHLDREREQFSALAMADAEPWLALSGDPGSGKSTFVNFVTLCMAGELLDHPDTNLTALRAAVPKDDETPRNGRAARLQPWDHGPLIPIRVILREFVARSLLPAGQAAEVTGDALWNDIVGALPHTLAAVEQFATLFPKVRILVTSRTYAYQRQDWKLNRFAEAGLAPFSSAQIRAFVERWYAHVGPVRGLSDSDIQGQALLLNDAIRRNPRLSELAARPLLLTLMASLHAWRQGKLPDQCEELYADAVDLLLDQWESRKLRRKSDGTYEIVEPSLAEWLRVDHIAVRQALNQVAFEAHRDQPHLVGTADITQDTLVNALMGLNPNPDPDMRP